MKNHEDGVIQRVFDNFEEAPCVFAWPHFKKLAVACFDVLNCMAID